MLAISVFGILKHLEIFAGIDALGAVTGTSNQKDPKDRRSNSDLVIYHHFSYEVDGEEYSAKSGYRHPNQMGNGAEIPIRYSLKNPARAEMVNPDSGKLYRA